MDKFWEGLGGKLAGQWVTTIFTPAFAFWLGGFIAWVTHTGWTSLGKLEMQVNQLTPIAQGALLIGSLLVIVVSSSIIQRLDLIILHWLEGYWPQWLNWLRDLCAHLQYKLIHKKQERFNHLVDEEGKAIKEQRSISPKKHRERVLLSLKLRLAPKKQEDCMPTKLGNILRAAENRPYERYGLVTTICWPRLWLVLPDGTKKEITEARATMDTAARMILWSLLFLIWTIWAWWAPVVTLLVAFWSYRWVLSAAEVYGDLLESAFDLYRFALYEALHFPTPKDTSEEIKIGNQLTTYLFYGSVTQPVTFQKPSDTKQEQQTGSEEQQDKTNNNKEVS